MLPLKMIHASHIEIEPNKALQKPVVHIIFVDDPKISFSLPTNNECKGPASSKEL